MGRHNQKQQALVRAWLSPGMAVSSPWEGHRVFVLRVSHTGGTAALGSPNKGLGKTHVLLGMGQLFPLLSHLLPSS